MPLKRTTGRPFSPAAEASVGCRFVFAWAASFVWPDRSCQWLTNPAPLATTPASALSQSCSVPELTAGGVDEDPIATTDKVTLVPSIADWLWGCNNMTGNKSTVSVALELRNEPNGPLTATL